MGNIIWTDLCSPEQKEQLQQIARSTTGGIWRTKLAKIILGILEGKGVDRLVLEVRVPPRSIIKCRERFAEQGMDYFAVPEREPTPREASVERMLAFLEDPPHPGDGKWDTLTHRYIGIHLSARQIQAIRAMIGSNPQYTRAELAREICARFALYQPNGEKRSALVADILKRMDMDNLITLPIKPGRIHVSRRIVNSPPAVPCKTIELGTGDIEDIQLIPVRTQKDSRLWNEMVLQHHYINTFKLFGPRLRYLVYGSRKTAACRRQADTKPADKGGGYSADDRCTRDLSRPRGEHLLAVLGFAASAWRIASRDEFIGWTDEQRMANLCLVIGNARFLILPWIKCPNLASRILSRVARQLPRDWEDRYHYRPVLLETFVDLDRFTGTCYQAANWTRLGTTTGYSLYSKKQGKQLPRKAIFVYPLAKRFRAILCGTMAQGAAAAKRQSRELPDQGTTRVEQL